MLVDLEYNRDKAAQYAATWALKRNPKYYNFEPLGGDCTNFISQCIFAGSNVMNYANTMGWYYENPSKRAAAWSGVQYLYNFLINNKNAGPHAVVTTKDKLEVGDIIQLGDDNGKFYHSLFVSRITDDEIYINTHTFDAYMRPLSSYQYKNIRYLHIVGVRKYK